MDDYAGRMRYPVPPLPALHAFEAAARLGSFTAAAEELHLSPSTVSHRLRELEANLGFALFERLPRSVRLTDLGKAYIPFVRAMFDELSMATVGLFGPPGGARVTVRTPVSYGARFLAPRVARFTADHDVRIWIVSAIWGDEAPDIEIDLEVDFSDARLASRQAETLATERAILVAHPDVAGAGRSPRSEALPGDLSGVRVLGYEDLWERSDREGLRLSATNADTTVDSWSAAIEVVAANPRHLALLPELLAGTAERSGQLVRIPDVTVPMRQTYRLLRPDLAGAPTAEVSAFADWLRLVHAEHGSNNAVDPGC